MQYSNVSEEETNALVKRIWDSGSLRKEDKNWVVTGFKTRKLTFAGFIKAIALFPNLIRLFQKKVED